MDARRLEGHPRVNPETDAEFLPEEPLAVFVDSTLARHANQKRPVRGATREEANGESRDRAVWNELLARSAGAWVLCVVSRVSYVYNQLFLLYFNTLLS